MSVQLGFEGSAMNGRGAEAVQGVARTVIDTAFGPLVATADQDFLVDLRFCWAETPPELCGPTAIIDHLRAELHRYAGGSPMSFTVPLAWSRVRGLQRQVLQATVGVAHGATTTYGELALATNRPGQARAVGGALRSNPWVIVVPCHRVVAADGALTGYGGGPDRGGRLDVKAALLAHERAWREPTLF